MRCEALGGGLVVWCNGDRWMSRALAGPVVAAFVLVAALGCAPRGAWTVIGNPTGDPPDLQLPRPVSCVTATSCLSVWLVDEDRSPKRVQSGSWDGTSWRGLPELPVGEVSEAHVGSLDCAALDSCATVLD